MKRFAEVTLCVPIYNSEKTLQRTLDSLIQQDFPVSKIKLFDNVSTDRSREICREYAGKYSYIELHENEKNLGAEGNFTRCLQAAEGDYCALVHADDIYEKDFISKSVEVLEANSDCVATFCKALEIDSNEHILGERFFPAELGHTETSILSKEDMHNLVFKYSNFITCPSVVARASIYRDRIKNWNGEKFKTSADLDVWMRLSEEGKIAAINKPLIKYRVADESYSFRVAKKRITRHDLFLVLDNYKSSKNTDDYNFLLLKDQAIRSLNIIRNKKKEEKFPCEVRFSLALIAKKMMSSKWHFRMSLAIIGINIVMTFLSLFGWKKECRK